MQDAADMLTALVVEMGYDAKNIVDPREAVKAAQEFRPSLILLDIGMPHINGYQLCPMLRKALEPAPVHIVAVTAWGSRQDRDHSRAAGFDAHLLKPVEVAQLEATMEKLHPQR